MHYPQQLLKGIIENIISTFPQGFVIARKQYIVNSVNSPKLWCENKWKSSGGEGFDIWNPLNWVVNPDFPYSSAILGSAPQKQIHIIHVVINLIVCTH